MYSVLKKVLEYRYPLYRSTGTRFKKLFLSIVFTILKKSYFLNIQPVYLGFVCDLPPGPDVSQTKKNTGSLQRYSEGEEGAAAAFLCTTNRGKLLQHQLIRVQCTKKVPEYRSPLYRSTGIRFKKLFLSIVFNLLKKSYF